MISDIVVEQILLIRDTGKYNMFDIPSIQKEAYDKGCHELVAFLREDRKAYAEFIMTGKR